MIKGIVLDFFGVFTADFGHDWVKHADISDQTRDRLVELSDEKDLGNITNEEYYRGFADATGLRYEVVERIEAARHNTNMALVHFVETRLKTQYKLYLASNASHGYIFSILDNLRIGDSFEKIFVSSDMHLIKPQPEFYQQLLKEVGIPAAQLLFVDDRTENVDAAITAGMNGYHFVGFTNFKSFVSNL